MKIIYPIKHWLTTLLISPIFLMIYDSLVDTDFVFNEPTIYLLFLTMGVVISLPGLAGYIYIFKQLQKNRLTDLKMRLILIPIAALMAVIAFWLIKGSMMIPMMLSYVTGVIVSGCVFSTRNLQQIDMTNLLKKEGSLSNKFSNEILNPTIDLSVDYSEIYLDDLIENEALKEIPLVKSIVGAINAGISINQFFFAKKLLSFIQEFNSKRLDPIKKQKFQERIREDDKFRKKVVEQTMVFIDRHMVITKTQVLAQLFSSFVKDKIGFDEYVSLSLSLEKIHPDSFSFLTELSETNFEVSQDKKGDKKFDEQALLLSSGVARETSSWSHGFIVSEDGKKLYELGIKPIMKK